MVINREWPTLLVLVICYLGFALITLFALQIGLWISIPILAAVLTLHSSVQHEVLHGHPFKHQSINDALVFPALGLFVPYERFRTLHLIHHHDPNLTDPYDDPESNYLDPVVWDSFSSVTKTLYRFNNTLVGRMLVGPLIGMCSFYRDDIRKILNAEWPVVRAYLLHFAGMTLPLLWWWHFTELSIWFYFLTAYIALSVLKIRTFMEHRAHHDIHGRTIVVQDQGLLALLFLYNNFHQVHHAHPRMPWFDLPAYYMKRKQFFDARNHGYFLASYTEMFKLFFLRTKDPVPHPYRKNSKDQTTQ